MSAMPTVVNFGRERNLRMKKLVPYLLIALIAGGGLGLRAYNVRWDQCRHLHPDERFLTMTSNALNLPASVWEYLDPAVSPLNPYNAGQPFFVYGTLPLTLNKLLVAALDQDHYDPTTIWGRILSALFDTLTIVLVFGIARLLERYQRTPPAVSYLAPALYAVAVLPIQLSHFFANDTFLCCFMTASFYFMLRFYFDLQWWNLLASGLLFGCACGTKVNAIFLLPLLGFFFGWPLLKQRRWLRLAGYALLFGLVAYAALRVADPRFFADANWLNPRVNPKFLGNVRQLRHLSSPESTYPPSIQWFNTPPVWFSLKNLLLYGIGPGYFLFLLLGVAAVVRRKSLELLVMLAWVLLFFLYQSTQFVKALRYFIFLYPFFALFTAFGVQLVLQLRQRWMRVTAGALAGVLILVWPISFMSIYTRQHSRVQASYWIHANIPENAFLAEEHWEDWLPVSLPDVPNRHYEGQQMPVFHPDNAQKIQEMEAILEQADYIIFTSNRGYGAIPHRPERFPYMLQFYDDLFAGRLDFKKIREFTSYPTLNLGFTKVVFKDDHADETFTVYDHPKVTIFQRIGEKDDS